jgi:hypothetical protein
MKGGQKEPFILIPSKLSMQDMLMTHNESLNAISEYCSKRYMDRLLR